MMKRGLGEHGRPQVQSCGVGCQCRCGLPEELGCWTIAWQAAWGPMNVKSLAMALSVMHNYVGFVQCIKIQEA